MESASNNLYLPKNYGMQIYHTRMGSHLPHSKHLLLTKMSNTLEKLVRKIKFMLKLKCDEVSCKNITRLEF